MDSLTLENSHPPTSKNHPQKFPIQKGPSKIPKTKFCINLSHCNYEIIKHSCENLLQWKVFKNDEENTNCDIIWHDSQINENLLAHIKPYQRLNHFPGINTIGRKNFLALHLKKMQNEFPNFYDFFPTTFCLPTEKNQVRKVFEQKKTSQIFIIKPDASSEGRGIFLTRRIEDIPFTDNFIVQKYITNPYLIDGLKFDLRIYVLITSVDPLTIYIYKNGIARFATDLYVPPSNSNLTNMYQHLTNYAINKNSKNFKFDKNAEKAEMGHKRSLHAVWKHLEERGIDSKQVWNNISQSVAKTICAIQPILKQNYRSSQPDDFTGGMCFQLLGFDVILNKKLKPKILEVNHAPSFNSDTPFDFKLKSELFKNMFELLQCNVENRNLIIEKTKQVFLDKFKNGVRVKSNLEDKEKIKEAYLFEFQKKTDLLLGNFEKVFPVPNSSEPYFEFMKYAENIQTKKLGVDNSKAKKKFVSEKPKIRSSSSIGKPLFSNKENENTNGNIVKLNQKVKFAQIQETVNRLYSKKNEEIKTAQDLKIVKQNLQMQQYLERYDKIKTSVVNIQFE